MGMIQNGGWVSKQHQNDSGGINVKVKIKPRFTSNSALSGLPLGYQLRTKRVDQNLSGDKPRGKYIF